jgi:hypothetical protein
MIIDMGMIELGILGVCAFLLLIFTIARRRRKKASYKRIIPAFEELKRAIGLSVEDGTRLHVSIGRANLLETGVASAMVGLGVIRSLVERTAVSDKPPVVTAGDPALAMLAQDTLQAGYQDAGAEALYHPSTGRLSGMGQFGYAAGAMPIIRDESVSASLLIGHSGVETALLIDAAERENAFNVFASENISAQAIAYAAAQHSVLGDDVFAAGAYLGAGASHEASLSLHDLLRWLLVLGLLAGAALKFIGVI